MLRSPLPGAHVVKDYISEIYPNMKLVKVIDGTGLRDQSEIDSVMSFVAHHPKLKGLIGITPTEAYMAADAIIQKRKGRQDLLGQQR